jgi:phosphatidylinositol alpha-1,6-mannosyltransferase
MRRKGQDTLISAFPALKRRVPDAALLIVGGGPYRGRLEQLAGESTWSDDIVLTGSVPWPQLPAHYAAGDVFAMPCRTRRRGLDVEGLGIVYLEASATELPVLAGDSGGAPDAVLPGETGWVVADGPRAQAELVERLEGLLGDAALRARVGACGRDWVRREWSWDRQVERLQGLVALRD